MAQYKHLPIYKATYDLLEKVARLIRNFDRDYKYTIGDKLRTEVVDLVVFIFKANAAREGRAQHISQILERMQVIELLLRLAKDLRQITASQLADVVVITDGIGRQAQGWIKSSAS